MNFVWITACIVKIRISQILKMMNLQLMSPWMKLGFVKGRNSHCIMILEMIGCSQLQFLRLVKSKKISPLV